VIQGGAEGINIRSRADGIHGKILFVGRIVKVAHPCYALGIIVARYEGSAEVDQTGIENDVEFIAVFIPPAKENVCGADIPVVNVSAVQKIQRIEPEGYHKKDEQQPHSDLAAPCCTATQQSREKQ